MLASLTNDRSTEIKKSFLLQSFPNPTSDLATIKYVLADNSSKAFIRIFDESGREVESFKNLMAGEHELRLNTATYTASIYFYVLINQASIVDSKRMVKAK